MELAQQRKEWFMRGRKEENSCKPRWGWDLPKLGLPSEKSKCEASNFKCYLSITYYKNVTYTILSLFIRRFASCLCTSYTHKSSEMPRLSRQNLYAHSRSDCLLSPGLSKMLFYIFLSFPLSPRCWEPVACCQCQCFVQGHGFELIR